MFSNLRTLLTRGKPTPRAVPHRRLRCETLEDRLAPALVGGEIHVNTRTTNNQNQAATASSNNGISVVVFTHTFASTDRDIYAQRFDRAGNRLGNEFPVTTAGADEHEPAVAMNDAGDMVVSWTEGTGSARNIRAVKILTNGAYLPVTVATTGRPEYDSSIGMASNGDFAVSYTEDWTSTDPDILVRQFNTNGGFVRQVVVADSTRPDRASSLAMAPDGRFGVAYESQFAAFDTDILVNRYNAGGGRLSSNFIDPIANNSLNASLAADRNFNLVVAYQSLYPNNRGYDIYARRLYADGTTSGEIAIRTQTGLNETNPSVALHPTNGRFVVSYNVRTINTPLTTVIQATEVSADNTIFTSFSLGGTRWNSSVTINADGRYLIAYTSSPPTQSAALDPLDGVYARLGQL